MVLLTTVIVASLWLQHLPANAGLTDIPDDITALSRLQQLSLDGCCYLKHIPDSLHRVKSLQELSLNDTSANMLVDSLQNFSLAKLSMRQVYWTVLYYGTILQALLA